MRCILFAVAVLASAAAGAQHGPRVGLGLATQSVGALFQNTSNLMPGPIVGWHFEIPVHQQFSIMPEFLLMTKGFLARDPLQSIRSRATFRYLEVPVLAKISVDQDVDGIYLLVGPSVGYFLSGRYKQWQQGTLITNAEYNTGGNVRRLEFSGVVGLGMESHRWGFDVRAQTSVTPFDRFLRIQNVVYSLTLAYRLRAPVDEEDPEEVD